MRVTDIFLIKYFCAKLSCRYAAGVVVTGCLGANGLGLAEFTGMVFVGLRAEIIRSGDRGRVL